MDLPVTCLGGVIQSRGGKHTKTARDVQLASAERLRQVRTIFYMPIFLLCTVYQAPKSRLYMHAVVFLLTSPARCVFCYAVYRSAATNTREPRDRSARRPSCEPRAGSTISRTSARTTKRYVQEATTFRGVARLYLHRALSSL